MSLLRVVDTLFQIAYLLLLVRVILSWVPGINYYHPAVQFIMRATSPILNPIRRAVPPVGGLDLINFGARETLPKKYEDELDVPGRAIYVHNPTVTAVGVTMEEAHRLGQEVAIKLDMATGPTALCVPLRGWGAVDLAVADKALGWAGASPGPVWIADPDHQEWTMRARPFVDGLLERIDLGKPNLDVLLVDRHMNEPAFADLMAQLLEEMLQGRWHKGSHHDLPEVVPFAALASAAPVGA